MLGYEYENDFYELSEFDEKIYDLKESLRKSVKKEVTYKIDELEKELEMLKHFRDSKDEYDRELDKLKRELERSEKSVEERAIRLRLPDILKTLEYPAWIPKHKLVHIYDKCDKCDDDRQIHFFSPSGKELKEPCKCYVYKFEYTPVQGVLFDINYNRDLSEYAFNKDLEINCTRLTYVVTDDCKKHLNDRESYVAKYTSLYKGGPFEKVMNRYQTYFRDLETCQKFCDYLNSLEENKT